MNTPIDLLARIEAAGGAADGVGDLDRLGIDDIRRRFGRAGADLARTQEIQQLLKNL